MPVHGAAGAAKFYREVWLTVTSAAGSSLLIVPVIGMRNLEF
jgi:hypothetical protein